MSSPVTIQIVSFGIPVAGVSLTQNNPSSSFGGLFQVQLSSVIPSYASNNLYKIFISGGSGGPNNLQPFPTNFLGDNTNSEVNAFWALGGGINLNGGLQSITQQFPASTSRTYFFQPDSTYIARTELPSDIVRYVYNCTDGALFDLNSTNCNLWLTYIPVA
jgi:hypothetical protein